jgi:hypothetical protein
MPFRLSQGQIKSPISTMDSSSHNHQQHAGLALGKDVISLICYRKPLSQPF